MNTEPFICYQSSSEYKISINIYQTLMYTLFINFFYQNHLNIKNNSKKHKNHFIGYFNLFIKSMTRISHFSKLF